MAKKRRNTRRKTTISRRNMRFSSRHKSHIAKKNTQYNKNVEQRRLWERKKPPLPTTSTLRKTTFTIGNTSALRNTKPIRIVGHEHCKRRKLRKSIIHALGKAGQGGQKTAKWTKISHLKC